MGLAETIATEVEFRTQWPRHAEAAFAYLQSEPSLNVRQWTFGRAVVRRPYLVTVLFLFSTSAGAEQAELWLSVSPDDEDRWSVLPVLGLAPRPAT